MNRPVKTKFILPIVCFGLILTATFGYYTSVSAQEQSQQNDPNYDPASANMAPVPGDPSAPAAQAPYQQQQPRPSDVQNESIQAAQQARQQGAPPADQQQPDQQQPNQMDQQGQQPPDDNAPLTAAEQASMDELAGDQVATQPPPELPAYSQPPAPDPDYLWTPGYWAYAPVGYYWVPGVWVAAPWYGALWTPGYWYFYRGRYCFHHGYWGHYIGFYGGINYGFGYPGYGFYGGYWRGNHFFYNRAVTNVNVTRIANVYHRPIVINSTYVNATRIAYNGGPRGIQVAPRPAEIAAHTQPRLAPMQSQMVVRQQAQQNQAQFYSVNRGRPATVAASQPVQADAGVHRPTQSFARPLPSNQPHSGPYQSQPAQTVHPGHTMVYPAQPGSPAQPSQPQYRPAPPQGYVHPAQPIPPSGGVQPGQPYVRPAQPIPPATNPQQPQYRPAPQQPQYHPAPPQQPAQPRQIAPPQTYQPNYHPNYQPNNQPYYQPRPMPEYHPAPEPQYHPMPQPQYHPMPQPQYHPAPQPHPQPQPQGSPQPHGGGHGR